MIVNRVQPQNVSTYQQPKSPTFEALVLKKNRNVVNNMPGLRQDRLILQRTAKYLGAKGEQNSTKYLDVVINTLDPEYGDGSIPVEICPNPGAYLDSFEFRNAKGKLTPGGNRLDIDWQDDYGEENGMTVFKRDDKIEMFYRRGRDNFYRTEFNYLPIFAQFVKLMDNISIMKQAGENMFDSSKEIAISRVPATDDLISDEEFIQKYGVEP